jgi:hypothetical protein
MNLKSLLILCCITLPLLGISQSSPFTKKMAIFQPVLIRYDIPIEPEAELLPEGFYFIIFNFKHVHRPILTKTIYFKQ